MKDSINILISNNPFIANQEIGIFIKDVLKSNHDTDVIAEKLASYCKRYIGLGRLNFDNPIDIFLFELIKITVIHSAFEYQDIIPYIQNSEDFLYVSLKNIPSSELIIIADRIYSMNDLDHAFDRKDENINYIDIENPRVSGYINIFLKEKIENIQIHIRELSRKKLSKNETSLINKLLKYAKIAIKDKSENLETAQRNIGIIKDSFLTNERLMVLLSHKIFIDFSKDKKSFTFVRAMSVMTKDAIANTCIHKQASVLYKILMDLKEPKKHKSLTMKSLDFLNDLLLSARMYTRHIERARHELERVKPLLASPASSSSSVSSIDDKRDSLSKEEGVPDSWEDGISDEDYHPISPSIFMGSASSSSSSMPSLSGDEESSFGSPSHYSPTLFGARATPDDICKPSGLRISMSHHAE